MLPLRPIPLLLLLVQLLGDLVAWAAAGKLVQDSPEYEDCLYGFLSAAPDSLSAIEPGLNKDEKSDLILRGAAWAGRTVE